MNLLHYSNSIELKIHGNPEVYIESLRNKIEANFWKVGVCSEFISDDILSFKRAVRPASDCGFSRREALKVLREGQIRFRKVNSTKIELTYEVQLDNLLVLSFSIGLVIGLFVILFVESTDFLIVSSLLVGLTGSTIGYLIGLNSILTTIDEVLGASIK